MKRTHRKKATAAPAAKDQGAAHVARPVDGCSCIQCAVHRSLARRDARVLRLARDYERARPFLTSEVIFSNTATRALIDALG